MPFFIPGAVASELSGLPAHLETTIKDKDPTLHIYKTRHLRAG